MESTQMMADQLVESCIRFKLESYELCSDRLENLASACVQLSPFL